MYSHSLPGCIVQIEVSNFKVLCEIGSEMVSQDSSPNDSLQFVNIILNLRDCACHLWNDTSRYFTIFLHLKNYIFWNGVFHFKRNIAYDKLTNFHSVFGTIGNGASP